MQPRIHSIFIMARKLIVTLGVVSVIAAVAGGCKPKETSSASRPSGGYFETPFQNEAQFVVDAIVSDLAEQMYFAKFHTLPDKKHFEVSAVEKGGTKDKPVFDLQVRIDSKIKDLRMDLKVDGPIWSPDVYRPVADELGRSIGLTAGASDKAASTAMLWKLLDSKPETIEEQNEEVSEALESDFSNPGLHEQAALLLGAFALREHSGYFFEIRSPLSRITAHLAMARFLRGTDAFSVNGQMAEALMLTLVGNRAPALERLRSMDTNDVGVVGMVNALRARNSGDYRPLTEVTNCSPMEKIEWFSAMADYAGTPLAWPKLTDEQKQTIDFVRIANDTHYSVEIGHQLLRVSIPLEMNEVKSIYEESHPHQTLPSNIGKVLNYLPEHCFSAESGKVHVHVIGWGQWAMFFQRQLCHAVQQNFDMMNYRWSVPDDAKEFAARCDESFGSITLYPFVKRFNSTDIDSYHKAVDDGFKLTVSMPQFVPASCWNYLCYTVSFAPPYNPVPNPHVNEWHNHNPLPGTVYNLGPRMDHPSLIGRGDVTADFERLRQLAPTDNRILEFIAKRNYNEHPTYDQAMELYHDELPYSPVALRAVAESAYDRPATYEDLMTQAAQIDPRYYYNLGDYVLRMNKTVQEDKAAQYYQAGYDADPDRVGASSHAEWLVRYWLKRNRKAKASAIAQEGGEVYSGAGLEAQAVYFELTSDYERAFEWFAKYEERYGDSTPLVNFCIRYKTQTGNSRFDAELKKRSAKLFPKGIEKVSLADFKNPPTDGVGFGSESGLMQEAGLKTTDVIVAVYGIRVHNMAQYSYGRALKDTPEMDLIVWQGDGYHEIKASPPGHLFGVNLIDYSP